MTEYITKEQVVQIAEELDFVVENGDVLSGDTFDAYSITDDLHRAINLAFEQRLEVVGYAVHSDGNWDTETTHIKVFDNKRSANLRAQDLIACCQLDVKQFPVYALKGDSK
jgi:uncharacterized tellurite resistance protein B-like protein